MLFSSLILTHYFFPLQSCSMLVSHLTTPPSVSVHETGSTSQQTPAGPALSTPGAARSPSSLAGTKSACEYTHMHTCTHAEGFAILMKNLTTLNSCSHPHFWLTVYLCWACLCHYSWLLQVVFGRVNIPDDHGASVCFRGPVNEDVFAAPAFHGGKIMDSDIQEISEQIHRLLLQVCTHTRLLLLHLSCTSASVSLTAFFPLSLSTTWAPAVTVATAATVPMNNWWASARPARATGTSRQETQWRRRARPSLPGHSRRFVRGCICWRTRTPSSACAPLPLHPHLHHLHPDLNKGRTWTVSSI